MGGGGVGNPSPANLHTCTSKTQLLQLDFNDPVLSLSPSYIVNSLHNDIVKDTRTQGVVLK